MTTCKGGYHLCIRLLGARGTWFCPTGGGLPNGLVRLCLVCIACQPVPPLSFWVSLSRLSPLPQFPSLPTRTNSSRRKRRKEKKKVGIWSQLPLIACFSSCSSSHVCFEVCKKIFCSGCCLSRDLSLYLLIIFLFVVGKERGIRYNHSCSVAACSG